MKNLPYIVSGDIRILLHKWARQKGFIIPGPPFFSQIRREFNACLAKIFPGYEYIGEQDLRNGIEYLTSSCRLPIVSLDPVYHGQAYLLQVTRAMNGQVPGIKARPGFQPIDEQFDNIARTGQKQLALVDDVLYSGECIKTVCDELGKRGIEVPVIYAGIAIGEGIQTVEKDGREVHCVRRYGEVIDEVCERDFYPGVPLSGKTADEPKNTGIPYILPFGNMKEWASIHESHQEELSDLCIQLACRLFTEIELMNATTIRCCDLDRNVALLPTDETRFIDALSTVSTLAQA